MCVLRPMGVPESQRKTVPNIHLLLHRQRKTAPAISKAGQRAGLSPLALRARVVGGESRGVRDDMGVDPRSAR